MSKFDLEAAKRGEAVQSKISGIWQDCYFIGASKSGYLVLAEIDTVIYDTSSDSPNLRMKPKQREMWIFPYSLDGVIYTSTPCDTMDEAKIVKKNFPRPAGDVQAILVEE